MSSRVTLRLFQTWEGGRKGPPPQEWRTVVQTKRGGFSAILQFLSEPDLGIHLEADLILLCPELEPFAYGPEFKLWEGHIVGHGEVKEDG